MIADVSSVNPSWVQVSRLGQAARTLGRLSPSPARCACSPHLHHEHHRVANNEREDQILERLRRDHAPDVELQPVLGNVLARGPGLERELDALALQGKSTINDMDLT